MWDKIYTFFFGERKRCYVCGRAKPLRKAQEASTGRIFEICADQKDCWENS